MLSILVLYNLVFSFVNGHDYGSRTSFLAEDDDLEDHGFGFMNGPYQPTTRSRFGPFSGQYSQDMVGGGALSPEMLRSRAAKLQMKPQLVMNDEDDDADKELESDTKDLSLLEKRLNATNKWSEFFALIRKDKEEHHGEIIRDVEPEAHKWAMYSRNLVKFQFQKPRPQPPPAPSEQHRMPSPGMSPYWDGDVGGGQLKNEMDQFLATHKKPQAQPMGEGEVDGEFEGEFKGDVASYNKKKMEQLIAEHNKRPLYPPQLGNVPPQQPPQSSIKAQPGEFNGYNKPPMYPPQQPPQSSIGAIPGEFNGFNKPSMYPPQQPPQSSISAIPGEFNGFNKPPVYSPLRNVPPQQPPQSSISEKPSEPHGFGRVNIMEMALKKMAWLEQQRNAEANNSAGMPTFPTKPAANNRLAAALLVPTTSVPWVDDFNSPIKWVAFNSHSTSNGLAQVTDPKTGKNRQYMFNGTILVPVIDYNLERLGWSTAAPTTSLRPSLTTDRVALEVVMNTVNMKQVDEKDWLAFEIVLGAKSFEKECEVDGCQARCHRVGCESKCNGDTCFSGCVGTSCSAYCRGPGCSAMCIGDFCTTKCEGLNCDSRCRGKECEATCSMFSCQRTTNGVYRQSQVSWDQMYPQYEEVPSQ